MAFTTSFNVSKLKTLDSSRSSWIEISLTDMRNVIRFDIVSVSPGHNLQHNHSSLRLISGLPFIIFHLTLQVTTIWLVLKNLFQDDLKR